MPAVISFRLRPLPIPGLRNGSAKGFRTGQYQIAKSGQSHHSFKFAPSRNASRVISARPRVIKAAMLFAPKPSPATMPARNCHDVLTEPTEFGANKIIVGVDAQIFKTQFRLDRARSGGIVAGGGQSQWDGFLNHLARERWTGQTNKTGLRNFRSRPSAHKLAKLRLPLSISIPFGRADDDRTAPQVRR